MTTSDAIATSRGRSLTDWRESKLARGVAGGFAFYVDIEPPLDAMRYTYLETRIRAEGRLTVRLDWDDAEGDRHEGIDFALAGSAPCRAYIRDHPQWRGNLQRLTLRSFGPFSVEHFTLFGEKDLTFEEKSSWPSEFAVVPRRRVVSVGESIEARLIVPNRLLKAIGENSVVFTLTDASGAIIAEKRTSGRLPIEPFGSTDFFSGGLGAAAMPGELRLDAHIFGVAAEAPLEQSVILQSVVPGRTVVFAEPFHYVQEFEIAELWGAFNLIYTMGPSDGRQAPDAPRAARQLGHAMSHDLLDWTLQPPILSVGRDEPEVSVRAPALAEHDGKVYLLYSSRNISGVESIRAAISGDMANWTRLPEPVYTPSWSWSDWRENRPSICRSPSLFRAGDTWVLFANAQCNDGSSGIASAVSTDLVHWIDTGPVVVETHGLQSPACIEHEGKHFLFTDTLAFRSRDPLRGWQPMDHDPRPSGWRGWRFTGTGSDRLAFAYRDLTRGNYVQAFRMRFVEDEDGPRIDSAAEIAIDR